MSGPGPVSPRPPAIKVLRDRWRELARLGLSVSELLTGVAILAHADESGEAYPGLKALQELTGLSPRQLMRLRRKLAALPCFRCEVGGSPAGGHRQATLWAWTSDTATAPVGTSDTATAPVTFRASDQCHPGSATSVMGDAIRERIEGTEKGLARPAPVVSLRAVEGRGRKRSGGGGVDVSPELEPAVAAWLRIFPACGRTAGLVQALERAVGQGYSVDQLSAALDVVADAKANPSKYRPKETARFLAEDRRGRVPGFVLVPSRIDELLACVPEPAKPRPSYKWAEG